jgi:hypothetical protein
MLTLMLDHRFKTLKLIYLFIGCKLMVAITIEFDRKLVFPMFFKSYHHSYPLDETKSSFATTFVFCVTKIMQITRITKSTIDYFFSMPH